MPAPVFGTTIVGVFSELVVVVVSFYGGGVTLSRFASTSKDVDDLTGDKSEQKRNEKKTLSQKTEYLLWGSNNVSKHPNET